MDAFVGGPSRPDITLRGGAALDVYDEPPAFDRELDHPSEVYVRRYCEGLIFLDPCSWLFYLPLYLKLALQRAAEPGDEVVEALLWNLRPPDRDPPRLGALSPKQQAAVVEVLEFLAFSPDSANQDLALQVLEEYWIPGALYRNA